MPELIEPSELSVKVAAPPIAVFSAVTMSPMVWPAVVVMEAARTMSPSGPFREREMTPPAASPLLSDADRPVVRTDGTCDWKMSFRPKNCEKPSPPRLDGLATLSCTRMPLPPVAAMLSLPLTKLALPFPPSAVFSAVVKLAMLVPMDAVGPPFTDRVPAAKFTSMRETSWPLSLVTAMVVAPLKFKASPPRRPVLRPAREVGGG